MVFSKSEQEELEKEMDDILINLTYKDIAHKRALEVMEDLENDY